MQKINFEHLTEMALGSPSEEFVTIFGTGTVFEIAEIGCGFRVLFLSTFFNMHGFLLQFYDDLGEIVWLIGTV